MSELRDGAAVQSASMTGASPEALEAPPPIDGDDGAAADRAQRQVRDFLEATRRLNGREVHERRLWTTMVTRDAIRHFAYGTSDDNPLWLDPSYADRAPLGRPVAPPAFLTSVLYPVLHGAPVEAPLSNLISELAFQWYLPVLEGDSLRASSKQIEVLETKDRNGETLICINSETSYWNQKDECVAKAAATLTRAPQSQGVLRVDRPIYRYSDEELAAIGEAQMHARRSGDRPLDPDGIKVGDELPPLVRGPMTIGDLVCWQAAIGPAYRAGSLGYRDALISPHAAIKHPVTGWLVKDSQQHEDFLLAPRRGMPLPFDNGVMRFAWICPLLTDWMGDDGTLQRLSVRLIAPNLYGDTTWYRGTIVRKTPVDEGLLTGIRITGSNQLGETTTIGDATVLLPLRPARSRAVALSSIGREADRLPSADATAKTVMDQIREQAERHPTKAAVIAGALTMTYGQLVANVDRLAGSLRRVGVAPEKIVGVLLGRDADYVVAALALFEAGAALLPLDSTYPPQRLRRILEEAAPDFLLTREALRERIPATGSPLITLEDTDGESVAVSSDEVSQRSDPGRTAYVLYTSGSTGTPVGVTVRHPSLFRYILGLPEALGVSEDDVFVHTASFAFSASIRQLFMPLSLGSTLVIADDNQRMSMRALFELIKRRGATVWDTVPSIWRQAVDTVRLLPADERRELLDHRLRLILVTGEALTWDLPDVWREDLQHPAQIINLYSQTETAGTVACHLLPAEREKQRGSVPVGRALAGAFVHILDDNGRLVPDGEVGEIVVGGRLASGYLRRPDLTAARFIPISSGGEAGERVYRTGDLGRRRTDGTIEFVGRSDDRIKLRGYRIEPGEIVSVLNEHPAVRHAVVVPRNDPGGHQRVVAYVMPRSEPGGAVTPVSGSLSPTELRRFATERLPNFMIPSAFVLLAELPCSSNGKLDRLALPDPDWTHPEVGVEPAVPRTAIERRLSALWADALGVEHVGTEDDFLELGGDSIKAMQILNRIREELALDLPGTILFSVSTVAALAKEIESRLGTSAEP